MAMSSGSIIWPWPMPKQATWNVAVPPSQPPSKRTRMFPRPRWRGKWSGSPRASDGVPRLVKESSKLVIPGLGGDGEPVFYLYENKPLTYFIWFGCKAAVCLVPLGAQAPYFSGGGKRNEAAY